MVMDFDVIKQIVKPEIIDKYDHSLVLNANSPHAAIDLSAFEKVFYLPYQPTSENLVLDFASIIKGKLPSHIELYKIVLSETDTSFAEWNMEDI
jgi:6-pyruvoyl-tetrahydropterin synthase